MKTTCMYLHMPTPVLEMPERQLEPTFGSGTVLGRRGYRIGVLMCRVVRLQRYEQAVRAKGY